MATIRLHWAHLALAAIAFAGPAAAGTISISTTSGSISVPGGNFDLTGFTGSVDLTLDGPTVTGQEIFGLSFLNSSTAGKFDLSVTLDGQSLSLPVSYDGANLSPDGSLIFTPQGSIGTAVEVKIGPRPRPVSSAITADFRLYSLSAPEPGGLLLIGAGGIALAAFRKLRPRRS